MSSNTTHPVNPKSSQPPTKDYPQPAATSERRASFLSTLFSMPSPPVGRHNSVSSTSTASSTSLSPSSSSSIATPQHEPGGGGPLTGSPGSSLASPIDTKFSPIDWSYANDHSPHSRQTSLSDSLAGFSLASSFRWPGSASSSSSAAAASNVQPISIPNSSSSALPQPSDGHHNPNPAPMVGMSAPTRRTSVGGPAFRRAFELPTYTNTYTNLQDNPPQQQQDLPAQADANSRRGRSGSLFSSFGVGAGDASKRANGPPRRKLSPMGERMIRDHPF